MDPDHPSDDDDFFQDGDRRDGGFSAAAAPVTLSAGSVNRFILREQQVLAGADHLCRVHDDIAGSVLFTTCCLLAAGARYFISMPHFSAKERVESKEERENAGRK